MRLLDTGLMKEALRRSWRQGPWLGSLFVFCAWANLLVYHAAGIDPSLPLSEQPGINVGGLCYVTAFLFLLGSVEMVITLGLLRMLSRGERVTFATLMRFTYQRFLASLRGFFPILWRLLLYSVAFMALTFLITALGGGELADKLDRMNQQAASPFASAILGLVIFILLLPATFATFDCVYDDLSFSDAYRIAKARVATHRLAIVANLLLLGLPALLFMLPGHGLAVQCLQQTISALLTVPPVMLFYLYHERFEAESASIAAALPSGLLPVDEVRS